ERLLPHLARVLQRRLEVQPARRRLREHLLGGRVVDRRARAFAVEPAVLEVALQSLRHELSHALSCPMNRTYSKSSGWLLMPRGGGAIHCANLPGVVTGCIRDFTYA